MSAISELARQRRQAVADVARRDHVELGTQPTRTAAVVGGRDDRDQPIARQLRRTFGKHQRSAVRAARWAGPCRRRSPRCVAPNRSERRAWWRSAAGSDWSITTPASSSVTAVLSIAGRTWLTARCVVFGKVDLDPGISASARCACSGCACANSRNARGAHSRSPPSDDDAVKDADQVRRAGRAEFDDAQVLAVRFGRAPLSSTCRRRGHGGP